MLSCWNDDPTKVYASHLIMDLKVSFYFMPFDLLIKFYFLGS